MPVRMYKQFLPLVVFLAILTVAVGGFASRGPANGGAATGEGKAVDSGPWFRGPGNDPASSIPDKNGGQVQIEREGDSHFYVTADINGRSVRMMVDSGASIIALTRDDAEAIGIDVDRLPEMGSANTAGGVVPIRPVELDRVRVEGLEVMGVQAAVIDADMPTSLLGQSFLLRLDGVTVEGDRMTLR